MRVAILLLGPLVLLILAALAIFGTAGPADNDLAAGAKSMKARIAPRSRSISSGSARPPLKNPS